MISELIKILPLVESNDELVCFAKGADKHPQSFRELMKWTKLQIKRHGKKESN